MSFIRIYETLLRGNEVEVEEASIFSSVSVLIGNKDKYDGFFRKCGIVVIEAYVPSKGRVVLAAGYLNLNQPRIFPITISAEHLFFKIIKFESYGDQKLFIDGNDEIVIPGIASEDFLAL